MGKKSVNNRRYLLVFSTVHMAGQIVGYVLLYILAIKSIMLISTAVLVGAAYYTAVRFVRENRRPPNNQEKWKLAGGSLIASIALWLTLGIVAMLVMEPSGTLTQGLDELRRLPAWAWMMIGAVVTAVYGVFLFLLYIIYGFTAAKYFERGYRKKPPRRKAAA